MTNPTCIVCEMPITGANDSAEHVLPNALGGRLKVRGFLCKACNDQSGHSWDAELARQLQALCLLVGVSRERGETPPMTVTTTNGQVLKMTAEDGLFLAKPTYELTQTETGAQIRISARTMAEARQMIEGAKAKYPNIDVEASLAEVQSQWSQPDGYMHHQFGIGGDVANRSIVKSAMAFATHLGLLPTACQTAVDYLRDPDDPPAPLGWYYATDVVEGRPPATPVTCVGVDADPSTGLVLGYVEYFGFHRAVIELGRDYGGKTVRGVYAFDPRTAEPLAVCIALPIDAAELDAIFDYQRIPDGAMETALAEVLPQALKRKREQEVERVLGSAVERARLQLGFGPDQALTEAQAQHLTDLSLSFATPWLVNRLAATRQPPPSPGPWGHAATAELGSLEALAQSSADEPRAEAV